MEAIGTLAGGIAHDFNNMLAAILGFSEMAIEDASDRPEILRSIRHVSSAVRARDLVKQILTYSRKSEYIREPLSITPVIYETVQLLRSSISAQLLRGCKKRNWGYQRARTRFLPPSQERFNRFL